MNPSSADINGPYLGAFAITPSDSADLPTPIRAISFHAGAGAISFIGWDDKTYTTGTLNHGIIYPVMIRRLRATGTTVSQITGWI
jgi:hypothetical protein